MKKIGIALSGLVLMIMGSCKKSDIAGNPPITYTDSTAIMGFRDSTLLIRTIQYNYHDASGTGSDSGTSYYAYDTGKKQITVRWKGLEEPGHNEYANEQTFTYNNEGLLIDFKDSPAYLNNIHYTYDGDGVLSSAAITFTDDSYTKNFTKTTLSSGGFTLKWNNVYGDIFTATADAHNNLLSYATASAFILSDSLIYDDQGNILKSTETSYSDRNFTQVRGTYEHFNFTSRAARGDQLYNLFKVLYNGLFYIPEDLAGDFRPATWHADAILQCTKFPALSTTVMHIANTGCLNGICDLNPAIVFNATPQFDSSNRLVKYQTFLNEDDQDVLSYNDISITYYK